jgi:hypothetical protein
MEAKEEETGQEEGGRLLRTASSRRLRSASSRLLSNAHQRKEIDLADVKCLIDDDVAFMSAVSQRLAALQKFIREHYVSIGLDPDTRKLTPKAVASLRRAFEILDEDDSGQLSWKEVEDGVQRAAMHAKGDPVDVIALSNTVRVIGTSAGDEITEDDFVNKLQDKACGETGPSSGLWRPIYRHFKRIDAYLGLSARPEDELDCGNDRYERLLRSQNINTDLAEGADGFADGYLDDIPMLHAAGKLSRGLMKNLDSMTEDMEIPVLGVYHWFALVCKRIAYSSIFFTWMGMTVLCMAIVEMALTYYQGDGVDIPSGLNIVGDILLVVFVVEVVMKVCAEGGQPWRYFTGYPRPKKKNDLTTPKDGVAPAIEPLGQKRHENRWNCFDCAVTTASVVQRVHSTFADNSASLNFSFARLIRLLRLCRMLRLVHYMPEMLIVITGG